MSDHLLERRCALDPASLSAREARRFVCSVLHEAGRSSWAEAAELAVSEVVANVVLHAHTAFELTVRLAEDHVRVEVHDYNPALPRQRGAGDEATTGRGMALVAAVTDAHGVTALGPDGKVVWFCVGSAPAPDPDDLLAAWDDDPVSVHGEPAPALGGPAPHSASGAGPGPASDLVTVTLRAMPATLWLAARQHADALLRELVLYRAAHPDVRLTDDDLAAADAARTAVDAALDMTLSRSRLRGSPSRPRPPASDEQHLVEVPAGVDVPVPVPATSAGAFATLQDVLDLAERLAARSALLARPGLPEVVAVRDWVCEQVVLQLAGAAPTPWAGADDERFVASAADDPPPEPDEDVAAVRDSDRGAVAADEGNRIVAVSRPLAAALGYAPEDLVGRRVVTLVPRRYREAHVAGFTRYLATGTARVLGVEMRLPVLHRDGSEVPCTLVLEATGTASGRRVFTAWITPQR